MHRLLMLLLAVGSVIATAATTAQAQSRLALLIGNQAYTGKIQPLKNPHNDIKTVGKALAATGFRVTSLPDASRRQILSAVKNLAAELAKGGPSAVGFLYYSGHGVARPEDRANYLIPVDLKDTSSTDFWFDAVKLDDILGELERAAPFAAHFVVVDACREELKLPYKSAVKGFEPVAERSGMFIAFATALRAVALDESKQGGASGPYSSALAGELVKPGQDHLQLFQNVKEDVFASTARQQVPWERNGLLRRVYFAGESSAPKPVASPPQRQTSEVERTWALVKDTTDIRALEAFRRQYGAANPFFDRLAEARIEELKKEQVAAAPLPPLRPAKPPKPDPPTPAGTINPTPARCDGVEALVGNERLCLKPKDSFKDCDTCPELVVVPSGSFMMGSNDGAANERPLHKVTIAKAFAVGRFEVTLAEWDACVSDGGCQGQTLYRGQLDRGWGRDKDPLIGVDWGQFTEEYLPWLTHKTGKAYRLLTEAEWEYAARAGSGAKYAWGDEIGKNRANCNGCGSQWDSKQTAPVGSFRPNAFGLHDMHGNVWEWVADCYKAYDDAPAPEAAYCDRRVARGGSWNSNPLDLRAAFRLPVTRLQPTLDYGFRLARTLSP